MNAPLRTALALSALVHALLCVWAEVRGRTTPSATTLTPDRFSGHGIELETIPVESPPSSTALNGSESKTTSTTEQSVSEVAKPPEAEVTAPLEQERPRKPPRILPKSPAAPAPPSNTDRLSALPLPQPKASAAGAEPAASSRAVPAAGESETSGAASAASGVGAGAAYGAAGLPPGVRHLPRAFTRALALANRGDTRWRDVAAGRVGEAHLRLAVNADGQLGELEYASEEERDRLAPVVKKLFSNTLLLLKNGRFSVDARTLSPGVTRLRVAVEVTDGGPPSPDGDPVELFGLASAAPEPGKPGKSGFVLNSGRQVTAWVWIE
jgi:hypothetical protein